MSARRSIPMVLVWACALVCALVWSSPALAQRKHAFGFSFSSEGSGEGQLLAPGQMAVNESTGDLYVIDRGNNRVEIFSSSGAYVGQFNGSTSPTGSFSFGTRRAPLENSEGSIAVDNSTNPLDPSKGDVYVVSTPNPPVPGIDSSDVVDKFTASGEYVGQLLGTAVNTEFKPIRGIAVDREGGLWVEEDNHNALDSFNDAAPVNEYVSSTALQSPTEPGTATQREVAYVGVVLDPENNLYAGVYHGTSVLAVEFSSVTGQPFVNQLDEEETTAISVDESSGYAYVDHESGVAVYDRAHHPVERFGSGQLQGSEGLAVNSATGTVYASNATAGTVDAFPAFVVPDASTGEVSNLTETSATVNGVVNPDGLPVTSCVFEYGTSEAYGQSAPCASTPSGSSPVAVSANLTGLSPLAGYHYRLRVDNANGSGKGVDRAFVTPEPVALSEAAVTDVSATSALFSVQLNPGGVETTYSFEYGTGTSYGQSVPVPADSVGAGTTGGVTVSARPEGLLAETTYHVRVAARNVLGTVYGPDLTFTTQVGGGAFMLPDGRQWELVSPPNKDGAEIYPLGGTSGRGAGLIQAAVAGNGISYRASGPVGSNVQGDAAPFGYTQVLSRRGADGWSSEDITTAQETAGNLNAEYEFFSADLSSAIIGSHEGPLRSPEAIAETPYIRNDENGSYRPLVGTGDVASGVKFTEPALAYWPLARAVTPDFSHVLVASYYGLTGKSAGVYGPYFLYVWSGGHLRAISTPNGSEARLRFGGDNGNDARRALSSDGSRVFFGTDEGSGGELFMEDLAREETVEVDAPASGVPAPPAHRAKFEIASADGSKVFFLDEQPLTPDSTLTPVKTSYMTDVYDLYVYDVASGSLTDLSVDRNPGEQGAVQDMVVGASEDGSIVYFVAKGKLAEGAQPGQYNLYVESQAGASWSPPRLVAVLSREDSPDWGEELQSTFQLLRNMTSRVSGDGRYLAFMSDRSLTGYDNHDAISGQPDEELFLYDEATGTLRCVSCNPTGGRPQGVFNSASGEGRERLLSDRGGVWQNRWLAANIPGWDLGEGYGESGYQSRALARDGRLFFDSPDALVPQATNGKEDVYEYEPGGTGGCARAAGCVALISSGVSAEESAFLDASESGDDVFFLTSARLVAADRDAEADVYDAHVCSVSSPCVSAPVAPPPCASGDACKAAPSPQPAIFGAPASATFAGAGNVASSQGATVSSQKGAAKRKRGGKRGGGSSKAKRRRGKPRQRGRSVHVRGSALVGGVQGRRG